MDKSPLLSDGWILTDPISDTREIPPPATAVFPVMFESTIDRDPIDCACKAPPPNKKALLEENAESSITSLSQLSTWACQIEREMPEKP